MFCSKLDLARLNVLGEVKNSALRRGPKCRPQSTIVVGGGPAGMLAAIHCLHSVLLSGGNVRLHEKRDGK